MATKGKQNIFTADKFTATEFYTAEQKAEFANRLAYFLLNGCQAGHFTKILYQRLSNCFGHIAHYDQNGFYRVWFSTPDARLKFIQHTLERKPNGDPKFTFVDVEREIQTWLKGANLLAQYDQAAEDNQHYVSVYDVAKSLLKVAKAATAKTVEGKVSLARQQVESEAEVTLADEKIAAITERLVREFVTSGIEFKLVDLSGGTNSFGHHGHIFLARTGEVWQCSGYRGPGGCGGRVLNKGDVVNVVLKNGVPDWTSLGYEVPEKMRNASADQIERYWGNGNG